jgi:hypothetical protein
MLAFDLYVVMGLFALVILVTLAIVILLLVFAVQAGLAAVWRWATQEVPHRANDTRFRR